MSDKLKKLIGKNKNDYELVAFDLINKPDVDLFKELVDSDDYLFDFIKNNVAERILNVCNSDNYENLIQFLKFYSPSYEDSIVSVLVKYADEELTDKMLEIFECGSENEKIYCAKFFSCIQDPLALEFLKENAKSSNPILSSNCISALAAFGDREIYNKAINDLKSSDDFETLDAVKTLVSYGDISAVPDIIETLKKSSLAESIAAELPYLCDLEELINTYQSEGLYILNLIINGLGETVTLAQVFDFRLYDILNSLLENEIDSKSAIVLLNAKDKFGTLTENDEYLFDESKNVKQEIYDIKSLLKPLSTDKLIKITENELYPESLFIYYALDFTKNSEKIRSLLTCNNQTVVLKAVEVLKSYKVLTNSDKKIALSNVSNDNIKNIITAI